MITEIRNDADLDREFIDKKGFVLLELGASWCRPCQVMAPAFKGVEEEFKGEVRLCHIDVDEAEDLAARFAPEGFLPSFSIKTEKNWEESSAIVRRINFLKI